MARSNERPNTEWILRDCTFACPNVREVVNSPTMGLLGTSTRFWYTATKKQLKNSIDFTEEGRQLINSDSAIEMCAGERGQDGGETVVIHSRRGNVTITADRTGCVKISGLHMVISSSGTLEIDSGDEIRINGANMVLEGNSIESNALAGNLVPPAKTFLGQVFEDTFVGGGTILKVLGLFVG
jgi:hypothetical protein